MARRSGIILRTARHERKLAGLSRSNSRAAISETQSHAVQEIDGDAHACLLAGVSPTQLTLGARWMNAVDLPTESEVKPVQVVLTNDYTEGVFRE